MEARIFLAAGALALAATLFPTPAHGSSYRTANFVVEASSPELAEKIGKQAEYYRRELAIQWIGSAMPNWSRPCPILAQVAPNLGAGGATSFVFDKGEVFNWDMKIQGSEERLLDSVLPHEVTHTIFASYFRKPLPRWADEGACTTVEHSSERDKQSTLLIRFLKTGHGIAFDNMFAMKEYPPDVLPLYSQGYSLARYLIDQGGRAKFMQFLTDGMKDDDWSTALNKHYGVANLKALQNEWLAWVKDGSPERGPQAGVMLASAQKKQSGGDGPVFRAQSDDRPRTASSAANDASRNSPSNEVASSGRRNDRGWTSDSNSMASADNSWQAAPPRPERDDAAANASGAPRKSIYDRKDDASNPPPVPTPPVPTPPGATPSNSSADDSRRDPQFLAMRDASATGDAGRKVLLEWHRPE
jgi:hypothetical protein